MLRKFLSAAALFAAILAFLAAPRATAQQSVYRPTPVFCASDPTAADAVRGLCPLLPAYIGPDPAIAKRAFGYAGIRNAPQSAAQDVQTPFDNMAWQTFIALNWRDGASSDPKDGLSAAGPRVWQSWDRVEKVFGGAPVAPTCANPDGLPVYAVASKGKGQPSAHNEEYLQASTNLPLIDVNGNWTVFERRLNAVEVGYLKDPLGKPGVNLTTIAGQNAFISQGGKVYFPASQAPPWSQKYGAIEIKAAWRILDQAKGDDPARYFTQRALLEVSSDLVQGGAQICEPVTLGLVGFHVIQKNAAEGELLDQWIWASFEHVDNAPLAKTPCDPTGPLNPACTVINQPSCGAGAPEEGRRYSYFDPKQASNATNVAPVASSGQTTFAWSSAQPFAGAYQHAPGGLSPQAVRCWKVYSLTEDLNAAWRSELRKANSVFANYMLIGTQWGANVEPEANGYLPLNAVPGLLSNLTLETYIQNNNTNLNSGGGVGSCVGCHSGAPLPVDNFKPPADFSFVLLLADPLAARPAPLRQR